MAYKLFLLVLFSAILRAGAQTDVLHLKSRVTDTIFGNVINDPYRWMEDPASDSLNEWLKEQKKITKAEQSHFNGRMTDVSYNIKSNSSYQYTRVEKTGGRFFSWGYSQSFHMSRVLYSRRSIHENYRVAFDPGQVNWKERCNIDLWAISDSSNYLAVVLSAQGSDWQQIRVSDMDSSLYFDDVIDHGKFTGIVWWRDGFFYGKYPDGGRHDTTGVQSLYYHKLGQKQDKDELITTGPSGALYPDIQFWVSSNKRYLVIAKSQKIGKAFYFVAAYKDLSEGTDAPFHHIIRTPIEDTCYYNLIDYVDSGFLFQTNFNAPHGRILKAEMNEPNHFYEIVRENEKVLKRVTCVHHQLVALYCTSGHYAVCMYNDTGGVLNGIRFSADLSVSGFNGTPTDTEAIFYEQSFYAPVVLCSYNFITQKITPIDKTKITFDADKYTTEIVSYKSYDGTDIPMYITYKKGLNLKGNNPVLLSGYGGFGSSVTPVYSYANIILFESGGILAVPMIRGGGEEGADWHAGGRKFNKQNSIDDFTAAAEYLKREGYTSKDKLAIKGVTNGALLVAAVMVQHPDLCNVVVGMYGIYDMLRYSKFTDGKYWIKEYGDPDSAEAFKNLLSYSPLQNLKPHVNYPAALFIAGRKNEHVVPMHTYKFLARLQQCSTGNNPHVLYFEEDAEHSRATGFSDYNDENAYILAFIFTEMQLPIKYIF